MFLIVGFVRQSILACCLDARVSDLDDLNAQLRHTLSGAAGGWHGDGLAGNIDIIAYVLKR